MISKRMILDTSNLSESDNVGAYLRASDGTLITKTTNGAKEGLDVNLINTSIAVTASDLDIRDLAYATDSVTAYQGGGAWSVSATNLDIRDLTHVTDSVKLGDGSNLFTSTTVGADIGLDVNLINASDIKVAVDAPSAAVYGAKSVTTSATDLVATDMVGRKRIVIQNLSTKDIYIGSNASVTVANGIMISGKGSAEFEGDENINFHAIVAAGTADIRVMEFA